MGVIFGIIIGGIVVGAFIMGKLPATFAGFILLIALILHWSWKR
jgi:hypothetical protein